MSKKVLILKQGGVQQFQSIGGGSGPSFMDLARRLKDPTASGWQKIIAGAGMAGKTAAGVGAVNQTLQQVHGGNAFAPLNINYAYQGLDPTTGMQSNVTPGEQQDAIVQSRLRQGAKDDLNALTDRNVNVRALAAGNQRLPPPAGLPAETPVPAGHPYQQQWTDAGRTGTPPPTYDPVAVRRNAAIQRGPPGLNQPVQAQVPPPVPAAPVPATTLTPEMIGATADTSVPTAAPASAAPATTQPALPNPNDYAVDGQNAQQQSTLPPPPTYAPNTGPNPPAVPSTPAPGNVNPQPQQDPTHGGRVDEEKMIIDGVPFFTPTAFQLALQRKGLAKSFASYVLDEFSDMLHKADPHVAGLLAFRVYMDKMMR